MQTQPSPSQKSVVLPQTRIGQVAVGLLGVFIAAMVMLFVLAETGQEGGDTILDNLWLGAPALVAGVSVITGGVVATVAVTTRGERSILAYVTILAGLAATVFIAGEVVSPH